MNLILTTIIGLSQVGLAIAQCFQDPDTNSEWAQLLNGDDTSTEFAITEGSCCMDTVCGLPCPEPVPPPAKVSLVIQYQPFCEMKMIANLYLSNEICVILSSLS